jgi:V/A-type H+-transporting ATPase subunit E
MPGAEKLIEKILSDAQLDAEASWADAEVKKQTIHDRAARDIERRKAEIERLAGQSIAENKKRMAAVYDLEYRKQLLAAKQDVMGQARSLAMEKLRSLDGAAYLGLMKRRLLDCAADGTGAIAVSKNEKRIDTAFLAEVNTELKKASGRGDVVMLPEKSTAFCGT